MGIASHICPKSFYIKGSKTAYLGFYCRTIFYDNDLKRFDRLFKMSVIVLDVYAKIGLFCDTKKYWVKGSVERFYYRSL